MSAIEYLLRVRPHADGSFEASIRQFAATSHPEVRAVLGPVSRGAGANPSAAMVAAIAEAHIETVAVPRESRYAC
jgi:ADP-ribosylglycohydrolase